MSARGRQAVTKKLVDVRLKNCYQQ